MVARQPPCLCVSSSARQGLRGFQHRGVLCHCSAVASITSSAMDGTLPLQDALDERLRMLNCTPQVGALVCVSHCIPLSYEQM